MARADRLRPFRAWDGEAVEPERKGGTQRYVLMASDDHPHLYREHGIPTAEALGWLVDHQHAQPGIQIAFGSSYDVNMILGDLPTEEVVALYMETDWEVELDGEVWRLQWIPGKLFNVRAPDGRWARTWDVYGFFQCSFVGALKRWGLPVPEYLEEMKAKRGTFAGGHEWELKAYSELECNLLVQLMGEVRSGLRSNGLKLRTWHGAGAIASAALRTAGAKEYLGREQRRPAVQDMILHAYYGGRTELFFQGEVPVAVQYDVNSAYAAALRLLSDGRGEWRRTLNWNTDGCWAPWGIWRVSWNIPNPDERLAPLPFRNGRAIHYPLTGEGWYHAPEVKAALRLYPDDVQVHGGYVYEPKTDAKPFEFVAELYELRQRLAAAHDPVATALKYGLASVWGKLSQATARDGKVPPYQDYFWAGACTALVRSWMLDMAAHERDRIVQISTDGLILVGKDDSPLDAKLGPGLGQLRKTYLQELLLAQPGMMSAWDAQTGERIDQTRGFFRREVDFEKLRRTWRAKGPLGQLATSGIRFIGIGSCIAMNRYTDWRKWKEQSQKISLHSSRKYYAHLNGQHTLYELLPPLLVRPGLSASYEPKLNNYEALSEDLEWVQGTEQPMISF